MPGRLLATIAKDFGTSGTIQACSGIVERCVQCTSLAGVAATLGSIATAAAPYAGLLVLGEFSQWYRSKRDKAELEARFRALHSDLIRIQEAQSSNSDWLGLVNELLADRAQQVEQLDETSITDQLKSAIAESGEQLSGQVEEGLHGIKIYFDALLELGDSIKEDTSWIRRHLEQQAGRVKTDLRFSLPAPPPEFQGRRAELEKLAEHIDRGISITSVRGMGGIGKTALALKLASLLKEGFPDGRLLVEMYGTPVGGKTPRTPEQAMGVVIRAFNPTWQPDDDPTQVAAAYRTVLDAKRVLLLFDNAADRSQVAPLVPPDGCLMMVTSRRSIALPGVTPLDLELLNPGEAESLLRALCSRLTKPEACDIARLCAYLPLALQLAGTALAERDDLEPTRYAERLENAKSRVKSLDRYETDQDATVQASLDLSLALLEESKPELVPRWEALCVFPASFDAVGAGAVWGLQERDDTADTLSDLRAQSLIEYDAETQRYSLHDLVREYLRDRLDDAAFDDLALKHAHFGHAVMCEAQAMYDSHGDGILEGLGLFDREAENIRAAFEWAVEKTEVSDAAARLCARFPGDGPSVMRLRLPLRDLVSWYESGVKAAAKIGERVFEATSLGNLGLIAQMRGDLAGAEDYMKRSLTISEQLGRKEGVANQLGNLGLIARKRGDLDAAEDYHTRSLAIEEELGRKEGIASELGNLGLIALSRLDLPLARARWTKARDLFAEVGALPNRDLVQGWIDELPPGT
ncbi:MAG: tetratricopeptide repeat protein [Planctomycetota bacterium]